MYDIFDIMSFYAYDMDAVETRSATAWEGIPVKVVIPATAVIAWAIPATAARKNSWSSCAR